MKKITNSTITKSNEIVNLAFLPTEKTWKPKTQIDKRFIESGEHLVNHLTEMIDQAEALICFTSFIFQRGKIVDALERATKRGVKVFVLTSDIRVTQQSVYDLGDEQNAVKGFKNVLNNQLRNKALVRMANNIHAKYLLIDPKDKNANGYLATCNFTEKATKQNPELVAVLNKIETLELFKSFVWHFWEATTDEQKNGTTLKKIRDVQRFEMPNLKFILQTSTAAKQTTIRDYTLEMIQTAKSKIVFSSFGFDVSHELGKALLAKCKAGLDIIVFARNRSKPFIGHLEKLIKAGAKVFTHDLLHAKFITVDDVKGAIFTANFEKHGMDEGVEVGLKLNKKDVLSLKNIAERWQKSFSHYVKANVNLVDLADNYFVMESKGLRLKTVKFQEKKQQTVKPQSLNQVIKVWSKKEIFDKKTIKNYHFELVLNLEEKNIDTVINAKELTSNIFWGEYEIEQKQKKGKVKQVKKQAIYLMEDVSFDEFLKFNQYRNLPVFAIKA